jgi:hypothetical protein
MASYMSHFTLFLTIVIFVHMPQIQLLHIFRGGGGFAALVSASKFHLIVDVHLVCAQTSRIESNRKSCRHSHNSGSTDRGILVRACVLS